METDHPYRAGSLDTSTCISFRSASCAFFLIHVLALCDFVVITIRGAVALALEFDPRSCSKNTNDCLKVSVVSSVVRRLPHPSRACFVSKRIFVRALGL